MESSSWSKQQPPKPAAVHVCDGLHTKRVDEHGKALGAKQYKLIPGWDWESGVLIFGGVGGMDRDSGTVLGFCGEYMYVCMSVHLNIRTNGAVHEW